MDVQSGRFPPRPRHDPLHNRAHAIRTRPQQLRSRAYCGGQRAHQRDAVQQGGREQQSLRRALSPFAVELLHFAQLGARATALGCAALELLVSTETVRLPPIAVHQRARVVLLPPVLTGASRRGVLASLRAPRAPKRRARPPTLQRELRRAACARPGGTGGGGGADAIDEKLRAVQRRGLACDKVLTQPVAPASGRFAQRFPFLTERSGEGLCHGCAENQT